MIKEVLTHVFLKTGTTVEDSHCSGKRPVLKNVLNKILSDTKNSLGSAFKSMECIPSSPMYELGLKATRVSVTYSLLTLRS